MTVCCIPSTKATAQSTTKPLGHIYTARVLNYEMFGSGVVFVFHATLTYTSSRWLVVWFTGTGSSPSAYVSRSPRFTLVSRSLSICGGQGSMMCYWSGKILHNYWQD